MRLIDADIFTSELFFAEADVCEEFPDGYCEFGFSRERIRELLQEIPPADVAPVRHGRWECGKPCPVCGGDRFEGLDADIWSDWEPPYCPNCGAKMDLEAT